MAANRAGDGLTAIRLAMIAVLVLFVLGPMLLDLAKVNRGSPAVNVMYDGRTYVRQTAGADIAKYIPTKFAGKDRTDWVLLVGLLLAAGLVGSIRTRIDWAMQAGKDIIRELGLFNRTVKLIKTDFSVRCGVNAGFVYFDETTRAGDHGGPCHRRRRAHAEICRPEHRGGGAEYRRATERPCRLRAGKAGGGRLRGQYLAARGVAALVRLNRGGTRVKLIPAFSAPHMLHLPRPLRGAS